MTFNELYIKMGSYGLYDLRDELLDWKNKNGYKLRDEITPKICDEMPDEFIEQPWLKMQEVKKRIYEELLKGVEDANKKT